MSLRAMATPMDAPTPAYPPMASANAALITRASIWALLTASTSTLPTLLTTLLSIKARVLPRMTLLASAPAPLTATPTCPKPAAMPAAKDTASILDSSVAAMVIPPLPADTLLAFWM